MVFSIFHFLKHYYNGKFHISFFKALLINERCEILAIFVSSVFNFGHVWFPCV
jgi:hypothetical protein